MRLGRFETRSRAAERRHVSQAAPSSIVSLSFFSAS
jgi:hypothetical protein